MCWLSGDLYHPALCAQRVFVEEGLQAALHFLEVFAVAVDGGFCIAFPVAHWLAFVCQQALAGVPNFVDVAFGIDFVRQVGAVQVERQALQLPQGQLFDGGCFRLRGRG